MPTICRMIERTIPRGLARGGATAMVALAAAAILSVGCSRVPTPAGTAGQAQPAGSPADRPADGAAPSAAPASGPAGPANSSSPVTSANPVNATDSAGRSAVNASAKATVTLRAVDRNGLDSVLQRHRGKVVLVDFWATWCAPCVALLPHTIALERKFGPRGLAVVTVSIDDPADEPTVRETLTDSGASGEQYLASYGVGPAAFEAFDIADGALPHLKLYDRQGRLQRAISSGGKPLDTAEIDAAVEALLE